MSLRETLDARLAGERATRGARPGGRPSRDARSATRSLAELVDMPSGVLVAALRDAIDAGVLMHVDDPAPGYAFGTLVREGRSRRPPAD